MDNGELFARETDNLSTKAFILILALKSLETLYQRLYQEGHWGKVFLKSFKVEKLILKKFKRSQKLGRTVATPPG